MKLLTISKTFNFHRRIKRNREREASLHYPALLSSRQMSSTQGVFYWGSRKKEVGCILISGGARSSFQGVHFRQLSLLPSAPLNGSSLPEICKTEPQAPPGGISPGRPATSCYNLSQGGCRNDSPGIQHLRFPPGRQEGSHTERSRRWGEDGGRRPNFLSLKEDASPRA